MNKKSISPNPLKPVSREQIGRVSDDAALNTPECSLSYEAQAEASTFIYVPGFYSLPAYGRAR